MKKVFYIAVIIVLVAIGILIFSKKIPFISDGATSSVAASQNAAAIEGLSFSERYEYEDAHISFAHPTDTSIETVPAEDGDVIIVRHTTSDNIFQIYIKPITEKYLDITADRLKKEVPDLIFRDPREVIMGDSGKGLAFISKENDDSSGDLEKREVWFALGGFLYQISAPLESDAFVQKVLNTWEFR